MSPLTELVEARGITVCFCARYFVLSAPGSPSNPRRLAFLTLLRRSTLLAGMVHLLNSLKPRELHVSLAAAPSSHPLRTSPTTNSP